MRTRVLGRVTARWGGRGAEGRGRGAGWPPSGGRGGRGGAGAPGAAAARGPAGRPGGGGGRRTFLSAPPAPSAALKVRRRFVPARRPREGSRRGRDPARAARASRGRAGWIPGARSRRRAFVSGTGAAGAERARTPAARLPTPAGRGGCVYEETRPRGRRRVGPPPTEDSGCRPGGRFPPPRTSRAGKSLPSLRVRVPGARPEGPVRARAAAAGSPAASPRPPPARTPHTGRGPFRCAGASREAGPGRAEPVPRVPASRRPAAPPGRAPGRRRRRVSRRGPGAAPKLDPAVQPPRREGSFRVGSARRAPLAPVGRPWRR